MVTLAARDSAGTGSERASGLSRRELLQALVAALGLVGVSPRVHASDGPGVPHQSGPGKGPADARVIVLGFDGVDPRLAQTWMEEGKLPSLSRLRREGGYRPMLSSNPAESPVAWSAFACGANPARTNIFDFLRRMPGSYNPEYALVGEEETPLLPSTALRAGLAMGALLPGGLAGALARLASRRRLWGWVSFLLTTTLVAVGAVLALFKWLPRKLPRPVCQRRGKAFWELLAGAGYRTSCIRIPVAFPPPELPGGRILAGLGVPDLRKSNGTFSYYATDVGATADTEFGGKVVPVTLEGGHVDTHVVGPRNFTQDMPTDVCPPLRIDVDRSAGTAELHLQGSSETLRPGQWSRWFEVKFSMNPLVSVWGIARFYLISVAPEFRLYLSPVNFHPHRLPATVDLSYPRGFVSELAHRVGFFKTLGWDFATWGLNEGRLPEEPFLEDAFATMETKWRMMESELEEGDWDCFVGVFEATDRIQHMFWWTRDPRHPAYDEALAREFGDAILRSYQRMDEIVGQVMKRYVDERTLLIVMSDHGFASFRRGVNLNTWLAKEGFLALRPTEGAPERDWNLEDLFGKGEFWPNVHWPKTQAYSLGLGQIYVNLIGREPQGSVRPGDEYQQVKQQIQERLRKLRDPETGEPVVVDVYDREDIYSGPFFQDAPDLVVGFEPGYRVSWQTCLGGMPPGNVEDNPEKWSGDHCSVDPQRIPGVLFVSRPFTKAEPCIFDVAPTVLRAFGLAVPGEMDGSPLGVGDPRAGAEGGQPE